MVNEAEKTPEEVFEFELFFVFLLATELDAQLLDGFVVEIVEIEELVVLLEQVAV